MQSTIPFYIADESSNVLQTLHGIIAKAFPSSPVRKFTDGADLWLDLQKEQGLFVAIMDINLPKIGALQIIKNYKKNESSVGSYAIVMTSSKKPDENLQTLQHGANDFLGKPLSMDHLIAKLRIAINTINLEIKMKSQQEDLTKVAGEIESGFMSFLQNQEQLLLGIEDNVMQRMKEATIWIANQSKKINEQEAIALEKVASLAMVGRLMLDPKDMNMPIMKDGMVNGEKAKLIPENVRAILGNVSIFNEAVETISSIYENYDGTGIPLGKKAWEIPLGARILRIILDYEEMIKSGKPHIKAWEILEKETRRLYDLKLLVLFDQYYAFKTKDSKDKREKPVKIQDIKSGMVISRNVYTESGIKIVSAGTRLDNTIINKILNITVEDSIIGNIYIKYDSIRVVA